MVIMKRLMAIFFILISSPVTADFESDLKRCLPESQHGIIDLIVQGESQRQPYAIGYVIPQIPAGSPENPTFSIEPRTQR
jgi:hypothetical protein